MGRNKNTKTHNIFCLDDLKIKETFFKGGDFSFDEAIKVIVGGDAQYKEQQLKESLNLGAFCVKLFYAEESRYNSRLASFCATFVKENQPVVRFVPKTASSILFIWSKNHMFAITTGQGFRKIENICVPKFGMQVVGILNAFRITALDSNTIASNIHSVKTIYSNEVDFIDIDNLDTIFKEVTGRLFDATFVRQLLKLDDKSKKKSVKITAKNYIQFSNSLDFNGLLHVLSIIDNFDFMQLSDKFNLILPINTKQEQALITRLNDNLIQTIYSYVCGNLKNEFDLFNKNANAFIDADSYSINANGNCHATCDDIEPIEFVKVAYEAYKATNQDTQQLFSEFFKSSKLVAEKGEDVVSSDDLLKHISGELQVDGVNYYIFYGEYYRLNTNYDTRLNATLGGKVKPEIFVNEIKTIWNVGDNEDIFNKNTSEGENYIHLHKIKPEYIEFADLVKFEDNRITICHVKDGFDGSMRELERQVELSIIRMIDLRSNNQTGYFSKLYQNSNSSAVKLKLISVFSTEKEFIDKMRLTDFRYVIVLHVNNKDLLQSRSNIAKHCLNSLILKCFNKGVELKINLV